MYRSLVADAPRELTCVAGLRLAPPAPWLAKDVHGKPIVALFVCSFRGARGGREPSSRRSRPSARRSATSCRSGRTCRSRRCSTRRSRRGAATTGSPSTCAAFEPDLLHAAPSSTRRAIVSPHSAILIFPLGGALNGCPRTTRRSATATRRPSSTSRARGSTPTTTREHRVGAGHVARPAPVLDRRHLHQLPDRGGRRRAHAGRVPRRTTRGWPRSRRSGIRRTCSARTRTSIRRGNEGDGSIRKRRTFTRGFDRVARPLRRRVEPTRSRCPDVHDGRRLCVRSIGRSSGGRTAEQGEGGGSRRIRRSVRSLS